jgi:molybdopterin-guanine dinucleotide biosynthesis protein A
MHAAISDVVIILAGGRATRLPGKLDVNIAGMPLLARVYENVRSVAPVIIAGGAFSPDLDARLDCPVVVDQWPDRGPIGGLLSACTQTRAPRVFLVAGDAPRVTANVLRELQAAWQPGDEAVVPTHGERLEPLAAFYDRAAVEREGFAVLHGPDRSMHALLARLQVRRIPMRPEVFLNINTPADLSAAT